MDFIDWKESLNSLLVKYRWAALVLAVGILLMMFPGKKNSAEKQEQPQVQVQSGVQDLQQELESLLSRMDGAGNVKLLLSVESGARNHYQTDADISGTGETSARRRETVLVTDSDRSQHGLLQRTDPPRYLGAVVLCQGADSPSVKLAVVDAVATATGLTSDKIAVWKMK